MSGYAQEIMLKLGEGASIVTSIPTYNVYM